MIAKSPTAAPTPRGPFSRPLRIHEISDKTGLDRRVSATPDECRAIAAAHGFAAVANLDASFHVRRRASGRYDVTGSVEATVTQVCVVSVEPFESVIRQEIAVGFAAPPREGRGDPLERARVVDIDVDDDLPDPIVDNTIDLGAVALEFLTLAQDFYPRKPGVHFTDVLIGEKDQPEPTPFQALERFKDTS
jgi:uncharacterized metal-binding protein YceD (DUF177 family)